MALQSDRSSYPGLPDNEGEVLRQWLRRHEREYDRFEYNVRVGKGIDPGAAYPEDMRRMSIANSQLRIDVIAWKGTQATILEVKERATPSAIGQIVTYAHLWQVENPTLPTPRALIVARTMSEDTAAGLQAASVPYQLVT